MILCRGTDAEMKTVTRRATQVGIVGDDLPSPFPSRQATTFVSPIRFSPLSDAKLVSSLLALLDNLKVRPRRQDDHGLPARRILARPSVRAPGARPLKTGLVGRPVLFADERPDRRGEFAEVHSVPSGRNRTCLPRRRRLPEPH